MVMTEEPGVTGLPSGRVGLGGAVVWEETGGFAPDVEAPEGTFLSFFFFFLVFLPFLGLLPRHMEVSRIGV